jgi:hypothetical protein
MAAADDAVDDVCLAGAAQGGADGGDAGRGGAADGEGGADCEVGKPKPQFKKKKCGRSGAKQDDFRARQRKGDARGEGD